MQKRGLLQWVHAPGNAPFDFREVMLTPEGMYEHQQSEPNQLGSHDRVGPLAKKPPVPVGSPYGFKDSDWKVVAETKDRSDELYVTLGFQFKSRHYTQDLAENIRSTLQRAVDRYNSVPGNLAIKLVFRPLAAGYGEHLFNEIARDIISSDIAIFDTSDLNPNVMIEMGVALTWDISVLPIKEQECEKPPSDVSGQTWADYRYSGKEFIDPDHDDKLLRLVKRAVGKKSTGR